MSEVVPLATSCWPTGNDANIGSTGAYSVSGFDSKTRGLVVTNEIDRSGDSRHTNQQPCAPQFKIRNGIMRCEAVALRVKQGSHQILRAKSEHTVAKMEERKEVVFRAEILRAAVRLM